MEQKQNLIITPKTKVLELIETYPKLEDILIEIAPAFKKLKNPVLRKTVAKIATLQQAASIGNVKTETLINRLRKEVGQEIVEGETGTNYNYSKPEWFSETNIKKQLNASEMLAAGEQPVNQVMADLKNLESGSIYMLKAPFLTAPIIDKASSLGMLHWIEKKNEDEFLIYFLKDKN
ncbi:MAG: DUF1858 domain-containing protein [Prolixibacteraceae bacterium]|nr:DUF1858 domain-containing protein [Prolixibacteraceae bacterium]